MARTQSRTDTGIWAPGSEFRNLTEAAQRAYWMLYSQGTISLCGVLALTVNRWAGYAKDSTPEGIVAAIAELEEEGYVIVDTHTEEVFVRTFARHDGVAKNSKTWGPTWRQLKNIASHRIREAAEAELWKIGEPPSGFHDGHTPSDTPSDTPSPLRNPVENRPGDTPSPGSLSLLPPPSSLIPVSPAVAPEGTGASHKGQGTGTFAGLKALTERVAEVCTATNRVAVQREAVELVAWATASVDRKVVEAAIGWAVEQDTPPVLPRALAPTILRKARDLNIPMLAFKPSGRRSA